MKLKKKIKNLLKPIIKFYHRGAINQKNSLKKIPEFDIIIDVGAGKSTESLYQHSKKAFIYAFEPNPNQLKILKKRLLNRNHKIFEFGLSNKEGDGLLKLNSDGSSLHSWSKLTDIKNKKFDEHKIKLKILDDVLESTSLQNKEVILKIDTEGHELKILQGSKKILSNVNYLLLEISIVKRFEDSYEMLEILNFLNDHNFKIGLITELGTWRKIYRYADILFVKKDKYKNFEDIISNNGI
jgi:FkbM family methyltransferase